MTTFVDSFWGEKNAGFPVLQQNLKFASQASKEFSDFLRESCNAEENYTKILARLAKQAGNYSVQGSYSPLWQILKSLIEKVANLHIQLMHSWQDLNKEVVKYNEEQHKKHKQIKDTEASTSETVQSFQLTITALSKAKELYHVRCLELERAKQPNVSQREMERTEAKHKKSNDEYKSLIEKYGTIRNDFEKKMVESCERFQQLEEEHIRQMKDFTETYAKSWEHQHVLEGKVHEEFRFNSSQLTTEILIKKFIEAKSTGSNRPGPIEYEEPDLKSLPNVNTNSDNSQKEFPILEKPSKTGVPGFLIKTKRRRQKNKKEKENKEKNGEAEKSHEPKVDEEGFSIRPENPFDHDDKNSWYSSSDSDSDEEKRKIKVEIKPLDPFSPNGSQPTSNNVDDIKKSIQGLSLSPTAVRKMGADTHMKRSQSISDTLSGKADVDLLNLDGFGASSSSASTPTGVSELGLSSPQGTPPSIPARRAAASVTPTSTLTLIGPPPSRSSPRLKNVNLPPQATMRPSGRQSPAVTSNTMSRMDSLGGLLSGAPLSTTPTNFSTTTSMPFGSSRGPSPLTIGLSDNIPIAVAFSETANALFRGTDDANCRVKLVGDLMMSFPAGIVRVLMDNPLPTTLSFKIRANDNNLENILVNKQLVSHDAALSTPESTVYSFDMSALADHLRHQAEVNRMASFFNIDILKYQLKAENGTASAPLHLACYWKCEQNQTDFRLDYKYNKHAMSSPRPLTSVSVLVPVDANVTHVQSKPTATWSAEQKRAIWRIPELGGLEEEANSGCMRAKFDLENGPSSSHPVAVQFVCDNSTLSGIEFELAGPGYRISLIKRRFISGKYLAEPEYDINNVSF